MGMSKYGMRATGSTLDPYVPRTNVNLSKFVVAYFGLCKFGGKSRENQSQIPKYVVKIHV
jgi:hypothetical protein